ncbi:MAG: response regulator transcription factor [Acetobacteraceae bacterium]|jgi:FixJ family two-component response regulator
MVEEPDTVLVVDDDASIRRSLADLLESVGLRVQLFASAGEFLRSTRPETSCCLVLDVRLPGKSGLDFQRDLNNAGIQLPIIFLTGHGDIPMSVRAMKAGAVEFLTKPFRDQELLDAVQLALEQDRAARADYRQIAGLRGQYDSLTPREKAVMGLLAIGRRNKQIAGELNISEITVKVHRTNLMNKMAARSLVDLLAMAAKLGLPGVELRMPRSGAEI